MIFRRLLLIALHAGLGLAIIAVLYRNYQSREQAVDEVRRTADREHRDTERMQHDDSVQRELLQGLRSNNPYVVELMAREKLQYVRSGEIAPPPLPVIDKTAAPVSK